MVLRMDKQYIDKHEAYMLIKHEVETHELPESKNAYERAARIVDQMRPVNIAIMEQKAGRWRDTITAGLKETVCSECLSSGFHHFNYCPKCGAKMEVE